MLTGYIVLSACLVHEFFVTLHQLFAEEFVLWMENYLCVC